MKLKFNKTIYLVKLLLFSISGCAQTIPTDKPTTLNSDFDKKISQLISFSVPLISVETLKKEKNNYILLDARELEEFKVSHIEGAQYIGYNKFDASKLQSIPKDSKIVLYCSIGYRSEKIGEKLQKLGYKEVYNLYGSIFEWANQGNPVIDENGMATKKVHGYNKNWSRWLDASKVEKIW